MIVLSKHLERSQTIIMMNYLFIAVPVVLCFFADELWLKYNSFYFYFFQYLVFLFYVVNNKITVSVLFSPTFITANYFLIYFIAGSYVTPRDIGLNSLFSFSEGMARTFLNVKNYREILILFLISNWCLFLVIQKNIRIYTVWPPSVKKEGPFIVPLFLVVLISLFSLLKIEIFNLWIYPGMFAITIYIMPRLLNRFSNFITRLPCYCILLLSFFLVSYESKRELLYVLLLILFFELFDRRFEIKFTFKNSLFVLMCLSIFLFFIMAMSIARGYGNFDVENVLVAFFYIGDYIRSDIFRDAIVDNLEFSGVYFDTVNCADYVLNNQIPTLLGSTFIKPLFLPIPRELFPLKPESMINIYTSTFVPGFYSRGGSLPVGFYGEAIANFLFFAPFAVYFLFSGIEFLYKKLIVSFETLTSVKYYIALFLSITIVQFARGSGLELWILYPLLGLPFYLLVSYLSNRK